jgi:hypothetical protein
MSVTKTEKEEFEAFFVLQHPESSHLFGTASLDTLAILRLSQKISNRVLARLIEGP